MTTVPDHGHTVRTYSPSPGDHVRIGVESAAGFHPLLWLEVKADNSLYLGPRFKDIATFKKGAKRLVNGTLTIRYDEGDEVSEPHRRNPKVSFHGSGRITSAGDYLWGASLRDLDARQEVCKMLFQHPKNIAPVSHLRDRDIMLRYPVDELRPLVGRVYAAPMGDEVAVVAEKNAKYQESLVLNYQGLDFVDLAVQVSLYHGIEGAWPPYTYILFAANDETAEDSG